MNIIMIGRNKSILESLERSNLDISVFLLEEKDIYNTNPPETYESPKIQKMFFTKYFQNESFMQVIEKISSEMIIHAVIPGIEYAVWAAYQAAKFLGVPNTGELAASSLTSKLRLRELCSKGKLPCPDFKRIDRIEDLYDFYSGNPIIFKPANRQASLGVIKVDSIDDIERAYRFTTNVEEEKCVRRDFAKEYIAEGYLVGQEYSVESLVKNNKVVFNNITLKRTYSSNNFVETGHVVPAPFSDTVMADITTKQEILSALLEFENGVMHSEWMLTENGPYLIECAGRVPGDMIPYLITQSYGFDFNLAYVMILLGLEPEVNAIKSSYSMINFFTPEEGVVTDIRNADLLRKLPVIRHSITVKPGDKVNKLQDSWSRVGFFIVNGSKVEEVMSFSDRLLHEVEFVIERH